MGKGDKKTKKGKIFNGTYGVRRPTKSWLRRNKYISIPTANSTNRVKEEVITHDIKEIGKVKLKIRIKNENNKVAISKPIHVLRPNPTKSGSI